VAKHESRKGQLPNDLCGFIGPDKALASAIERVAIANAVQSIRRQSRSTGRDEILRLPRHCREVQRRSNTPSEPVAANAC